MSAIDRFLQATRSAVSSSDLAYELAKTLRGLGFPHLSVVTATPVRLHQEPWRTVPKEYVRTYESKRWHVVDPILQFARNTSLPFQWRLLEGSTFSLSAAQSKVLSDMRALGLYSGVSVPMHGPKNSCDVISISRDVPTNVSDAEFDEVTSIAVIAWRRHLELIARPERPELPVALTDREAECLDFMKSGKTYSEMAVLLGVSRKTIDFHAQNLMHKLGANNRVTAVVSALRLGLIS